MTAMKKNLRKHYRRFVYKSQNKLAQVTGKKVIHFLHIGKTGGTAIKEALKNYLKTESYLIRLHDHRFYLNHIAEGSGEKFMFFLREPISRFVSGFNSRQRKGKPRYTSPWTKREREAFECFGTPNDLAEALSAPDLTIKMKAEHAMNSINHVNKSFLKWFGSKKYLQSRIDDLFFIGFQESLETDFQVLKQKLDLPKDLSLPESNLLSHKNPTSASSFLNDKAIDNLKTWYAKDIEFYHYCREELCS